MGDGGYNFHLFYRYKFHNKFIKFAGCHYGEIALKDSE